jgi:hypothetical protein
MKKKGGPEHLHFGKLEVESSRFQGSRAELHIIATPEFMKSEKPKLTLGKAILSISGFRGQRDKALNHEIHKITKFGIPK